MADPQPRKVQCSCKASRNVQPYGSPRQKAKGTEKTDGSLTNTSSSLCRSTWSVIRVSPFSNGRMLECARVGDAEDQGTRLASCWYSVVGVIWGYLTSEAPWPGDGTVRTALSRGIQARNLLRESVRGWCEAEGSTRSTREMISSGAASPQLRLVVYTVLLGAVVIVKDAVDELDACCVAVSMIFVRRVRGYGVG